MPCSSADIKCTFACIYLDIDRWVYYYAMFVYGISLVHVFLHQDFAATRWILSGDNRATSLVPVGPS